MSFSLSTSHCKCGPRTRGSTGSDGQLGHDQGCQLSVPNPDAQLDLVTADGCPQSFWVLVGAVLLGAEMRWARRVVESDIAKDPACCSERTFLSKAFFFTNQKSDVRL